jgi:hypothetical protein
MEPMDSKGPKVLKGLLEQMVPLYTLLLLRVIFLSAMEICKGRFTSFRVMEPSKFALQWDGQLLISLALLALLEITALMALQVQTVRMAPLGLMVPKGLLV